MTPFSFTSLLCLLLTLITIKQSSAHRDISSTALPGPLVEAQNGPRENVKTTKTTVQDIALGLAARGASQQDADTLTQVMHGLGINSVDDMLKAGEGCPWLPAPCHMGGLDRQYDWKILDITLSQPERA